MKIKAIIGLLLLSMLVMSFAPFVFASTTNAPILTVTLLNQDPDPASPGSYLELRWKVTKLGSGVIKNLTFILEPEYPFSFDGSDKAEKNIGTWFGKSGTDDYYTLYYKLNVDPKALEGTYKLKLKWQTDDSGVYASDEFEIRVSDTSSRFVIGALSTSPLKLVADTDEAKLAVQITNIGDGSAENARAKLILPEGFLPSYNYADEAALGTIASGASATANFYIDIAEGLKYGTYSSKIELSYKDANDDTDEYKKITLPLDITIMQQPDYEILSVEPIPKEIRPGDTVELKIGLKNIGGGTSESTSIKAYKESSQPFEFEDKSDFVGKLESGDSADGILKLIVSENAAPKDYLLDVEIRGIYKDQVIVKDKTIKVSVSPALSKKANYTMIGIVAGIVVIGAAVFYTVKKK